MSNIFLDFFAGCVKNSETRIPVLEGDYQDPETGLWICGKCNTAKQCEQEFAGQTFYPMCLCACESARVNAEKAAEEFRQKQAAKQRRMNELYAVSLIGERQKECRFDNFQENEGNSEALRASKAFAERFNPEIKGLMLMGGLGVGKTHLAAAVANALIEKGYCVVFTSIVRILNAERERPEILQKLTDADLLIIDDLGAERKTGFGMEKAYDVINERYNAKKPLMVTTNITFSEFKTSEEINMKRIFDRISGMCFPVAITGESHRLESARKEYAERISDGNGCIR